MHAISVIGCSNDLSKRKGSTMARPVGRRGETRERALQVALELFAEHGVSGTSLQMIANRLNVTKAAVYHQFATKDEIVMAVIQPALDLLISFVEEGEAEATRAAQVDRALVGLVELVLEHGRLATVFTEDPAVVAIIHTDPAIQALQVRMGALLVGPDPEPATRVAVSIAAAGLLALGTDPLMDELDQDTLRREMLASARRLLGPVAG
jgi:AcrR family transcriptional regulator